MDWHPVAAVQLHLHTNSTQNTKNETYIAITKCEVWSVKCGPCPVLASYTLAFALQLRKKHGKTSVRVQYKNNWTTTIQEQRTPLQVEKHVENAHLIDLGLNGKVKLKRIFNKFAGHCERSYEPSGSMKCGGDGGGGRAGGEFLANLG